MGVQSLSHRRQLISALVALGGGDSHPAKARVTAHFHRYIAMLGWHFLRQLLTPVTDCSANSVPLIQEKKKHVALR